MMRRIVVVFATLILASLGYGLTTAARANDSHLVSVYDQGENYQFLTKEKTIDEALRAANISLGKHDSVEPSLDEEIIAPSYQVNIYRARPVIIVDGTTRLQVSSSRQVASQIAAEAGIPLHDEDLADFSLSTDLGRDGVGQLMTIRRATAVSVNMYGKIVLMRTQARTVEGFLQEKSIHLGDSDRLSIPKSTTIAEGMTLRIWREGVQTISIDEEIAPTTRLVYDSNRPLGYRTAQDEGQPGLRTISYQIDIQDGQEVSRTYLTTVTTREPRERVEVVGLKNDGRGLTVGKGAQYFTDSRGISHRETYYDLPMNVVMNACGQGGYYTVRPDGAKVDRDGYIIIAANYGNYPRCSIVETSLGPGKVYDTGDFAKRHPHGFDLATDWTNNNGR